MIKKIYEQITTNSEKYNFQIYVKRTRYYIIDNDIYSIGIQRLLMGDHVLGKKIDLIKQHGQLLDTVLFE